MKFVYVFLCWSANPLLNSKLNLCSLYSSSYVHAPELCSIISNHLLCLTLKKKHQREYRLPTLQKKFCLIQFQEICTIYKQTPGVSMLISIISVVLAFSHVLSKSKIHNRFTFILDSSFLSSLLHKHVFTSLQYLLLFLFFTLPFYSLVIAWCFLFIYFCSCYHCYF